jgi:hypothetical protein
VLSLEERFSLPLSHSLSLSLTSEQGSHTLFTTGKREKERDKEGGRGRKREKESVKKREGGGGEKERIFIFKRNDGCLGTF